jgi:hypothetical protein
VIEVNKKVLTGSGNLNKKERKKKERKKERKKDDYGVAISAHYGVASFSSWSKVICNPDTGIARIRGPLKTNASF